MNKQTGAVAEKETSEAEYLKVQAMAYRHGMTMEEYAIALAVSSSLPEPKTEQQMFVDLKGDLERLKTEGTPEDSVEKAISKLRWIELISRESKGKKATSPKAQKGNSTTQPKPKVQ